MAEPSCHTRRVTDRPVDDRPALVLAFPGQGSLRAGAGDPWTGHEAFDVVRRIAERVDRDLVRLLTSAGDDELVATDNAQLGTFALSLCVLEATGLAKLASFAVGHSLGEYTALVAAGILDESDGAGLVAVRGSAMLAAAAAQPGGLVAVLGGGLDAATAACAAIDGQSIANVNGPGQIVLGGSEPALATLEAKVKELGFRRAIRLPVGGAFHTPLMAPALAQLEPVLASTHFATGHALVVANVDGSPYDGGGSWPHLLSRQLLEPVRFDECVQALPSGASVVECGAGSVLQGLISRIRGDLDVVSIAVPDDLARIPA
jgi:[acyl-carrier-protein] S-malonyltransferase